MKGDSVPQAGTFLLEWLKSHCAQVVRVGQIDRPAAQCAGGARQNPGADALAGDHHKGAANALAIVAQRNRGPTSRPVRACMEQCHARCGLEIKLILFSGENDRNANTIPISCVKP
ncbi:hypothetical protein [Polaromonas sp. CG_9.11]|uniref:hypothetical protein n=1 Tax=Polaromonas sp. CG_9.11 TaxID=2787730 RepID=UPI0018CA941E|nr:hypothetical protein [Polaromonas sp. CG_9.11]MBG6075877.1 hypothetical protein [Polaromonas sp. CG_9.11]